MKNHWFFICLLLFFVCLAACQKDEPEQPQPQLAEESTISQTAVAGLMAEVQGDEAELVAAQATAEAAMAALATMEGTAVAAQSEAEIQANWAFAHQIAALSLTKLDTDLPTAVLLAVQASKMADTPTTRSALLYALQHNPRLQRILPADNWPTDVDFSPDGRFLATALPAGQITLYNLTDEEQNGIKFSGLSARTPDEGTPSKVAFNFDGTLLAGGNPLYSVIDPDEIKIIIWDVATQQVIAESTNTLLDLAFLTKENFLISYGSSNATLWEVKEGQLVEKANLEMPEDYWEEGVSSMAVYPDSEMVTFGYRDGSIRLWNPFTNQITDLPGFDSSDEIGNLTYTPNGSILAISTSDQVVLWDTVQNKPFGTPILVQAKAVEFSQDGQTLLIADNSETIRLWDVTSQTLITEPLQRWGNTHWLLDATLHPDGNLIASSYQDRLTIIWNETASTRIGKVLKQFPYDNWEPTYFNRAFVSPNTLVADDRSGSLVFFDVETGSVLSTTSGFSDQDLRGFIFTNDYSVAATHVYSNEISTITIWDIFSHESIGQSIVLTDSISSLAFNPDGSILATGSYDGLLQFWDATTGMPIGEPMTDHSSSITTLAFSQDGQILASSDFFETHVRDVQIGQLLFPPITIDADELVFHPQNNTLITIKVGFPIYVWNITTGANVGVFPNWYVNEIIFSPDGKYRVSSEFDRIREPFIALWDDETQLQIGPALYDYRDPVFNQDSSVMATTHFQYNPNSLEVVLWDMGLARWQEVGCRLVNQNFSEEGWGLYFGERPYEQTCPLSP